MKAMNDYEYTDMTKRTSQAPTSHNINKAYNLALTRQVTDHVMTQTGIVFCCRHDVVQREVKELEKGIAHLHNCMARYNALIADNADLKVQLVNDNFHLETKIRHELQVCC